MSQSSLISPLSTSPLTRAKLLRDPPPSLFLGPPSQNASHVSLPGTSALAPTSVPNPSPLNPSSSLAPLIRQRSQRTVPRSNLDGAPDVGSGGSSIPRPPLQRQREDSEGKKQADRTDVLWAEMQRTLEEVQLSAVNGVHVFGTEHSRALEELRAAQIGLAQAWARSEADDVVDSKEPDGKGLGVKGLVSGLLGVEGKGPLDVGGTERGSNVPSGSGRPGSSGVEGGAERMANHVEQETETEILLARRRREANDRYFQRVNGGVLEVVAKLEAVATAMASVEQESKDIWGENESSATSVHSRS